MDELGIELKNHLHEIQDRDYPLAQGVWNFRAFSDLDFETLRDNDFKRADAYEKYAEQIANLSVLDVDSMALKYALAVSKYCRKEHGQLRGQFISRIHQHKTKFNSTEGYTARALEAISGGNEFNNLEKIDQAEIDKLGAKVKALMQEVENERLEINRMLQQTKTELTSKYKSEFD